VAAIAAAEGLEFPVDRTRPAFEAGSYADAVRADGDQARTLGITGCRSA